MNLNRDSAWTTFSFHEKCLWDRLELYCLSKNLDGVVPFLTVHTVRHNPSEFVISFNRPHGSAYGLWKSTLARETPQIFKKFSQICGIFFQTPWIFTSIAGIGLIPWIDHPQDFLFHFQAPFKFSLPFPFFTHLHAPQISTAYNDNFKTIQSPSHKSWSH